MAADDRTSKLVEILRHLAERLQDRRLAKAAEVRRAGPLERQRADIFRIAGHRLRAPNCSVLAWHLLRLAGKGAVVRLSEGQGDVIGDGHQSTVSSWCWFRLLKLRALLGSHWTFACLGSRWVFLAMVAGRDLRFQLLNLRFEKRVGDQRYAQGRDGVAMADGERLLDLVVGGILTRFGLGVFSAERFDKKLRN